MVLDPSRANSIRLLDGNILADSKTLVIRDNLLLLSQFVREDINIADTEDVRVSVWKLDGVAPLIADPSHANATHPRAMGCAILNSLMFIVGCILA